MSKLDQIRGTFNRVHDDLFDADYEAEFINTSLGMVMCRLVEQ